MRFVNRNRGEILIRIAGLTEDHKSLRLSHNGWNLAQIAAEVLPEHGGYACSIDGKIIAPEEWQSVYPGAGSSILFVPDFGDIIGGAWAIFQFAASAFATVWNFSLFGLPVGQMAILTAGSYLLNKALMPKLPGEGPSPSQAYSWDPATTQQQGLPVPKIYGKVRLHGNIIACYVLPSADSKKLLIYALVAFGEGPVKSISDVRIQKQPYQNFADVTVETRRGLLNQTCISFFDKTRRCYKPNRTIKHSEGAFTWQTPGNDFDDVEIIMCFNVWHYLKSGGQDAYQTSIKIEAKKSTDESWTTVFDKAVPNRLGGVFFGTNPFWRKWKLSDAMAVENGARYDIRVTKTCGDIANERAHNDVCLEFINEVLNDALTYPGMVLAGVAAISSDELSPPLDVSAEIEGAIVDYYDGSDWVLDYSNNPAWIMYDVLTQPVISGDTGSYQVEEYEGMDWSKIVDADWYELAQFCDTDCPDGNGGTEKRITFNGIFDTIQSLWDAVLQDCDMARCIPYWRGSNLRLAINKAKDRVGMLTVGNILQGSFEESFSGNSSLASEVEVTYNDSDKDFERTTLPIYSSSLTTYQNKVQLAPLGIARQSEAWRYAKFRLAHNELLKRSMKVEADIDCIGYHLGDRIGIQHDVPNWNALKEYGCRGGGRIISYTPGTNDTLTLDCNVEGSLEAGETYEIAIRLHDADTPVIKTILSVSGSDVTISGQFTGTEPQADDLWAIGKQNLVLKDFVIIDRKQTEEQQFVLELIEYNANLWTGDEANPVVPDVTAIAPRADRPPVVLRRADIERRVPDVTLTVPTVDILWPTNLKWTDNDPDSGSVSWSAEDGDYPIVVSYKGVGYEITAGNSNLEYIYWDISNPNVFGSTNVKSEAIGEGKFIVCHNEDGVAQPYIGGKEIPGQLLISGSIGALPLVKAMQPFMHDLSFLPGDSADQNKHNAVHWAAGTIKFSDGSTQSINAGQITGLGDGVLRYIYFGVNNANLQNTSEYSSVATETTRLLATVIVSSDPDQEIGILENQNTGGNWIRDLLAPRAISSDQLKDFSVAVKKTNLTVHQIY